MKRNGKVRMIENCSSHINPPCPTCSDSFAYENCDEVFGNEYLFLYKGLSICDSCYESVKDQ